MLIYFCANYIDLSCSNGKVEDKVLNHLMHMRCVYFCFHIMFSKLNTVNIVSPLAVHYI